jgi:NADPH-dependent curcumin reductase CurA
MAVNRQWLLASHPEGMPDESDWRLVEGPIEQPGPGEILVRAHYLSVDPYMRGRISRRRNYAAGVELGAVMTGGGVGEVVESKDPQFAPGDVAESFTFGWQEYAVLDGAGARKVDPGLGPIHSALRYLGRPGLTAYFGGLEAGRAQPGQTVLVSAAAGAVGQIAGQLAKLAGCRAVAVASSKAKLAWCRELGYDAGIDYRSVNDLAGAIADACSEGVDLFLDNTAGPIHDAVMPNLARGARVVVCGQVALADRFDQPDIGPRFLRQMYAFTRRAGLASSLTWSAAAITPTVARHTRESMGVRVFMNHTPSLSSVGRNSTSIMRRAEAPPSEMTRTPRAAVAVCAVPPLGGIAGSRVAYQLRGRPRAGRAKHAVITGQTRPARRAAWVRCPHGRRRPARPVRGLHACL